MKPQPVTELKDIKDYEDSERVAAMVKAAADLVPPEAGNVQLPEPDDIWREWQHERVLIAGLVGFFFGLGFFLLLTQPIWSAP